MSFINECLDRHNILRAKHGAPSLKISNALNVSAQKWADNLMKTGSFQHSVSGTTRRKNVGENLFSSWSSDPNATVKGCQAADNWYSEIKDYNFGDSEEQLMKFFSKVGHFTQLVWDETEYLGVGYVFKNGKCVVVAQYEPAGNMVGRFKKHVKPVGSRSISEVGGSSRVNPNPQRTVKPARNNTDNKILTDSLQNMKVSDKNDFASNCLSKHNHYRKLHGVSPLTYSSELAADAGKFAKFLAENDKFSNSTGRGDVGESLYYYWTNDPKFTIDANRIIDGWYKESDKFPVAGSEKDVTDKFQDIGHFTQMVWKGSREFGVGYARNGEKHIVVARYKPAGNVVGRFLENVKPRK